MPWTDPQFWMVTAAAGGALWVLLRPFWTSAGNGPACGSCASGAAACARRPTQGNGKSKESPLVVLGRR